MLRSILNSARGKSALPYAPPTLSTWQPPISRPLITSSPVSTNSPRPDRCCVYCGHALYAPPRSLRVRCPRCFQELPVKDLILSQDLTDPPASPLLTSGKILITPNARISATLVACTLDIAGLVLGDLLASHTCHIRSTGKVAGHILCRHLHLEPGAELQGHLELIRP